VGAGFQPAQPGALPGQPQVRNLRPRKWVQVFNLHNQEPCLENRRLKTCGHFDPAPQVEKNLRPRKWEQVFNLL
jgi:hypothetical protein